MSVDKAALDALHARAAFPSCDALHVVVDGEVVLDWASDRGRVPIEAMSVTKSVVSMVVGRLVALGNPDLLDRSVADFVPEWRDEPRSGITVRHLLDHTSGLQANKTTEDIYASDDFVRHGIDAPPATAPGEAFFYNNKAYNLLAHVVREVSGQRMDVFTGRELFQPLDVGPWTWSLDRAGNPHGMSGLQIRAADLAKLGLLMMREGDSLLTPEWVRESTRPSRLAANYGLGWWLTGEARFVIDDSVIAAWRNAKPPVEEAFIARVLPLKDRVLTRDVYFPALAESFGVPQNRLDEWHDTTWRRGLPDGKPVLDGFYGEGWLGQYLVVLPRERLVAVHMRTGPARGFEGVAGLISALRTIR